MGTDDARPGTRDNGLRCPHYVAVADLDPRLVAALLDTLRAHGIAAYAAPAPGRTGGYGETQLPSRPLDRLWADETRIDLARSLVRAEAGEASASAPPDASPGGADDGIDFDATWAELVAALQADGAAGVEPGAAVPAADTDEDDDGDDDEAEDEHFEPPAPPPLPRLRPVTIGALVAIVLGLAELATGYLGAEFTPVAVLAVVGGAGSLVWHMRNGPPTDSGWDDGAVV